MFVTFAPAEGTPCPITYRSLNSPDEAQPGLGVEACSDVPGRKLPIAPVDKNYNYIAWCC